MDLCAELVFNPTKGYGSVKNLACCDNKLHIKLKKYFKPTIIFGIEQKLSLVLTYYLSKYLKDKETLFKNKSFEEIITAFKTTEDYQNLSAVFLSYSDIMILPFYNHKKESKFGALKSELYLNLIDLFKNLDIINFIFEDKYYIKISKISNKEEEKAYSKFIKKELKQKTKKDRSEDLSKKYIPLW